MCFRLFGGSLFGSARNVLQGKGEVTWVQDAEGWDVVDQEKIFTTRDVILEDQESWKDPGHLNTWTRIQPLLHNSTNPTSRLPVVIYHNSQS